MGQIDGTSRTVDFLKNKIKTTPDVGIILGSGLGDIVDSVENKIVIPYSDIPGFPISTVKGHAGNLIFGEIADKEILIMQGRFHFYEGHSISKVVFGVRIMGLMGIKTLFVTNAAGGINTSFQPGDLMVIKDHINLSGENPAIGEDSLNFGPRFFDMTYAYDRELIEEAKKVFSENDVPYNEGIYTFLKGPCYETPAEVKMLEIMGADAVGMSTVPEVIAARQMGIRVFGVSCITNMAAGISDVTLSHQEVMDTSFKARERFIKVVCDMIKRV